MLQQPVRLGGLAVACALATSTLVLVAFLVSNVVLSVIGGIGQVAADPGTRPEAPAAALLSTERETGQRCERAGRDRSDRPKSDVDRCADPRREGTRPRP